MSVTVWWSPTWHFIFPTEQFSWFFFGCFSFVWMGSTTEHEQNIFTRLCRHSVCHKPPYSLNFILCLCVCVCMIAYILKCRYSLYTKMPLFHNFKPEFQKNPSKFAITNWIENIFVISFAVRISCEHRKQKKLVAMNLGTGRIHSWNW